MHGNWRIGSTSYVYRGSLLHNLRALAGEVDDVELILFDDGAGATNLPAAKEVGEMAALIADSGMSVTVHLPRDVGGSLPDSEVRSGLALNLRVIGLTQPINPLAYVLHAHTQGNGTEEWYASVMQGIEAMTSLADRLRQLALENLESYAPEILEPLFAALPIGRTLDVGHLWKQCRDPLPVMERWLPEANVVHLHGACERQGRMVDHLSLASMEEKGASPLFDAALYALQGWRGVLTLEVFEEDYFTSRAAFERALARIAVRALHAD